MKRSLRDDQASSPSHSSSKWGARTAHAVLLLFVLIVDLADDDWLEGRHTATTVLRGHERHRRETKLSSASRLRLHCGARVNNTTGAATSVAAQGVHLRFTGLPQRCRCLPGVPESRQVLFLDVSLDLRHVGVCEGTEVTAPEAHLAAGGVAVADADRVASWKKSLTAEEEQDEWEDSWQLASSMQ